MSLVYAGIYYFVAMIFGFYFGKTYFEDNGIEYSYEAGYMCVVAPVLGLLWPLALIYGVGNIILRRIL